MEPRLPIRPGRYPGVARMTVSLKPDTVFAVTDACAGCGACIKTCPEKAIQPAPRGYGSPLIVLEDRCTGCAECAEVCPVSACIEVLLEER